MPPLSGFSDNAFEDRKDVEQATLSLLQSLCKYQSPGGARITIPVSTGTHFDETAAQLEGFARPLWAVGALLACGSPENQPIHDLAMPFVLGLANGTNPEHPEYWGAVTVCDQRMVEMEIISFALLVAPEQFYHTQNRQTQANIKSWLMTINGKDMPVTNWRWFRVLTNLALIKVCDVPEHELRTSMKADLDLLDTFNLLDGWSADGVWNEKGRQADYYSGSFAIQFSQLMYVKFAEKTDPKRCKIYRERAYLFSKDFCHYFNQAGFWSAAAYAEVELSTPTDELGAIKGFLLRHLRWWSSKHEMFNADGTLSIGFTYPNMYMCEDYNSPQSVYWCMKSFCCLGLSESHPFWQAQEKNFPLVSIPLSRAIRAPMQIVCNSGSHHFMLSSGQYCPWPLKATEAKYGKFAYSSHFGFSVPTGPLIQQIAPDNTLAIKICDDDSWKVRWISEEAKFSAATLSTHGLHENIPVLVASWRPWKLFDVVIRTALIAPTVRWPNWHIRIHRITIGSNAARLRLEAVEGGFAIYGRKSSDGLPMKQSTSCETVSSNGEASTPEITYTTDTGCLVSSSHGMSGIRRLQLQVNDVDVDLSDSEGHLLKPDSNTNLVCQRTVIPMIKRIIPGSDSGQKSVCYFASAVFAVDTPKPEYLASWDDFPTLHIGTEDRREGEAYIRFTEW